MDSPARGHGLSNITVLLPLLRRDMFAVHLTARRAPDAAAPGGYVCPVTDRAAGRGFPFVALPACGHALSERALRQVSLCLRLRRPGSVLVFEYSCYTHVV